MATKLTPEARLADAALRILAKKAWQHVALADVAKAAKLPMSDLAQWAPAKLALVGLILQRFGRSVAGTYKPDRNAASARDRLFDVAMAWFDVLASHKTAIRSIHDGIAADPLALLGLRNDIVAAAEWLMTLAEADKGPALALRAAAFAAVLGRALSVWLDDDADLTKTMARFDGDLRRGESWLAKF